MELDLLRNIRISLVFLNIFDLNLEENKDIDENTYLKVFDKQEKEVGKVYFEDRKVKIITNTNFGLLKASYDVIDFHDLNDIYLDKYLKIFTNKIEFTIDTNKLGIINGIMTLDNEINYLYDDYKTNGEVLIELENEKEKIFLTLKTNGTFRFLKVFADKTHEIIDINPYATLYDYFYHDKTEWNEKKEFIRTNYQVKRDFLDKLVLKTSFKEFKNGSLIDSLENYHEINDINSPESLIIKGALMRLIDEDVFLEIKKLRDLLSINDVSLLNKLIDAILFKFTNLEILSLLGLEKNKINYQNGFDNLESAYLEGFRSDKKLVKQKRLN